MLLHRNLACWLFGLLLAFAPVGFAQDLVPPQGGSQDDPPAEPTTPAAVPIDARFESPRETILTYLEAMSLALDHDSKTGMDTAISVFEGLEDAERHTAERTARRMLTILNKIEDVKWWTLPTKQEVDGQGIVEWVFYPRDQDVRHQSLRDRYTKDLSIILKRDDRGAWQFTSQTSESLSAMENALLEVPARYGSGQIAQTLPERIHAAMPASLRRTEFLTIEAWQWLGLLLIIFMGLAIDLLSRAALRAMFIHIIRKRGSEPDRKILRRSLRPFGMLLASILWYYGLLLLDLPITPERILRIAARFFLMLSSVLAAYRVTDLISEFFRSKASATTTKFDDLLIPLLRKTAKLFVTAMGVIYIAESLNIEILPLLTGLGIGGLAFAFAAKDTVENFFGSIAVIADRPFEVGDWVVINDTEGTVEELGLRSTRIRTFYNSLITVPNSTLVRANVDNYGKRRYRRFTCHLGLTYNTPPEKIEAFCAGIREIVERHPYTRKDYHQAWLNKFGPSSLDVLVYIFHECPDWSTEVRERHRFMLDVLRLADKLGVEFAFPTQTLHLSRDTPVERPTFDTPPRTAEHRAVITGKRAAREILCEQPWMKGDKPGPVTFQTSGSLNQADLFADLEDDEPHVGTETTES